jgi:hypothetical protein
VLPIVLGCMARPSEAISAIEIPYAGIPSETIEAALSPATPPADPQKLP